MPLISEPVCGTGTQTTFFIKNSAKKITSYFFSEKFKIFPSIGFLARTISDSENLQPEKEIFAGCISLWHLKYIN